VSWTASSSDTPLELAGVVVTTVVVTTVVPTVSCAVTVTRP
jgi:hypothetical protein